MSDPEPPDDDAKVLPLIRKGGSCPICSAPSMRKFRPFCSRRCAEIDLGRWMKGNYAIPGDEPLNPDEISSDGDD